MVLPVVALLIQAAAPPAAERPIRVWLGSRGAVAPGERVQLFVKTASDGYLTVLRRTTDGRIDVLFPTNPADEAFVPRGTYEVRGSAEGGAFVALEPPGTGLVLAALSPTRFRPHEFVHQAAWNPEALVPSWSEADAEGALTDIVQRMLGAGYFAYDIVEYTVAPRAAVPQAPVAGVQGYETCVGCVVPSVTVVIVPAPILVCDPFFVLCEDLFFFRPHRRFDREPAEPPVSQGRTLALATRPSAPRIVVPRGQDRPRFVVPERPAAPSPIAPRPRTPDGVQSLKGAVAPRAIPVLRGVRPPKADARPASPRGRHVRLVMPRTPARVGPAPRTVGAAPARTPATLVAVTGRESLRAPAAARVMPVTRLASPAQGASELAARPLPVNGSRVPASVTRAERTASAMAAGARGQALARVRAVRPSAEAAVKVRAATAGVRRRR